MQHLDDCPAKGSSGEPVGLIPVPRGMSAGFYAFMGAGGKRSDSGEVLMLTPQGAPHAQ
jgi:hypothetical protein